MAEFYSEENLKTVVDARPDSLLFAHLAVKLLEQDKLQQAIDVCKKGVSHHPEYAFGHYIYGLTLFESGDIDAAKHQLETAVACSPQMAGAWKALSRVNESLNLQALAEENRLHYFYCNPAAADTAGISAETDSEQPGEAGDPMKDAADTFQKTRIRSQRENDEEFDELLDDTFAGIETKRTEIPLPADPGKEEQPPVQQHNEEELSEEEIDSRLNSFINEYEKKPLESESENPASQTKEPPADEREYPDEFLEEEGPLDFSEVISELIGDRESEP
ncbi:MAG: hypothetical protein WAN36_06250, partial [Calditrichia bacterium]